MSVVGRVGIGSIVMAAALVIGSGAPGAAPPPKDIVLTSIGAYDTPFFDQGAVEIAAYDSKSQRAFLTFASLPRIEVIDLSDPANPSLAHIISLTPWGGADAHATSVAVHNGVVAVGRAAGRGRHRARQGRLLRRLREPSQRRHRRRAARHADLQPERQLRRHRRRGPAAQQLHVRSGGQRQHHRHARRRRGAHAGRRHHRAASRRSTRRRRSTRASASSDLARPSPRISSRNTWRSRTTRRRPG